MKYLEESVSVPPEPRDRFGSSIQTRSPSKLRIGPFHEPRDSSWSDSGSSAEDERKRCVRRRHRPLERPFADTAPSETDRHDRPIG
ncbi:hypothetical protein C491_17112 [Natronococcus amylolyticus DSM 10524]|uniref:Uncharacterized protein n=1 Tax=Natronococcus amylolyticus DSM 10524 TaxID=1227497 RepID=L9X125_9EURY|nr:hypothetical protein C491_17112 [Natronococcus amylolyticus DSM 10524]